MSSRTRIELDRFELWTVLGIMGLFSGLLFTFGIMVGLGMRDRGAPQVAAHGHGEATKAGEHSRAPASTGNKVVVQAEPAEAGASLKAAYAEAKQAALREAMLQENRERAPKSIADAAAHFEANNDWNRRPAQGIDDREAAERIARLAKEEEKRLERGPESAVTSLFERKPGSLQAFEPRSGQFTVHLGSYATKEEATAKVAGLRRLGFNDAYVGEIQIGRADRWYRVSVGSFVEEKWALKEGQKLVKAKAARDFKVKRVE